MEGKLIKNRYKIIRKIGEGGMGKTYLAKDQQSQTEVVLKMLNFRSIDNWKILELFEREVETLKNIDHPNIPDYIDYFYEDSQDDRMYYLVQEYVNGKTFRELIQEGKKFSEEEILSITKKILSILEYLQSLNPPVIHRDINPKNLIMKENGDIYLVDFGAVQDTMRTQVLGSSTVVGTYGYMPMEQIMGNAVCASDIYALGVSIIFLLSHKEPGEMPLKNMELDYKPYLNVSKNFLKFLDAMTEADVNKRLANATKASEMLTKIINREAVKGSVDLDELAIPYGSKIKINSIGEKITISLPGNFASGIPIYVFLVFWFGFLIFFTGGSIGLGAPIFFTLFTIPFWLAGLFALVTNIFATTKGSIELTPEDITYLKSRVLPFSTKIPLDMIEKIEIGQNSSLYAKKRKQNDFSGVEIIAGAKTIKISKPISEAEAKWLVQFLEAYVLENTL